MLLNYTPARPRLTAAASIFTQPVLLAGTGTIAEIAETCGMKLFITVEEYCAIRPETFPARQRATKESVMETLRKRFGELDFHRIFPTVALASDNSHIPVAAVFVLNDPLYWEDCIQLILAQAFEVGERSIEVSIYKLS